MGILKCVTKIYEVIVKVFAGWTAYALLISKAFILCKHSDDINFNS